MSPTSIHTEPTPNGRAHYVVSNPPSSTPTIDVSFERTHVGPGTGTSGPLWPHRLSASFSAMADQIAATSQALALVPSSAFSGDAGGAELAALRARMEGIERVQERVVAEVEALKAHLGAGGRAVNGSGESGITTEIEGEGQPVVPDAAAQAAKIEELEKKLNELSETVKLDQQRLPARLQNARATVMKAPLQAPVTANGKPVPLFPSTRGEFEHITKERYDALLKVYGQPLKGDTDAKRDTLRAFAGIPLDGK